MSKNASLIGIFLFGFISCHSAEEDQRPLWEDNPKMKDVRNRSVNLKFRAWQDGTETYA